MVPTIAVKCSSLMPSPQSRSQQGVCYYSGPEKCMWLQSPKVTFHAGLAISKAIAKDDMIQIAK